jgi:hypothetical protein
MNKYFTGNRRGDPSSQNESGRELSPSPAEIVVRTVRTGWRDYGLATVTVEDVQISQCAGLERSPSAFRTLSFRT